MRRVLSARVPVPCTGATRDNSGAQLASDSEPDEETEVAVSDVSDVEYGGSGADSVLGWVA